MLVDQHKVKEVYITDQFIRGTLSELRQNRMALEGGARLLLDKETLTREELPPLAEIRLAAAAEVTL